MTQEPLNGTCAVVLGTAQDAGVPSAGCTCRNCRRAVDDPQHRLYAASLAIIDRTAGQRWLLDCTPDFPAQLNLLNKLAQSENSRNISGILLTHAHIGHYAGLMHLGREVIGAHGVPVYAMPRMRRFIEDNAPWDQLVRLNNIELRDLVDGAPVELNGRLSVTPFAVPHRAEYSEAVGFRVEGPERSIAYLPDIDGWDQWGDGIERLLASVDTAFLDGTFYSGSELPGRNMNDIPHPLVQDSITRFAGLDEVLRSKVRFIHFNHTNPVLDVESAAYRQVAQAGLGVARQGEFAEL